MEKKKILIAILCLALVVVIGGTLFLVYEKTNDSKNKVLETDAERIKREYESLNNTTRESDGAKYNNVEIPASNPIVYIDTKEALDIIDNEDAIIYVGANWCPWCRNALPVLIDVANKMNVKKLYYLDLDDEKSIWEVEDNKAIKKIDGTKYYYKLLEKLDDYLQEYTLKDDNGKTLKTGEKRIYMPYVVGVKRGRVVVDHTGTVDLGEEQTKYDSLTDKQREELTNIYMSLFDEVFKEVEGSCSVSGCE